MQAAHGQPKTTREGAHIGPRGRSAAGSRFFVALRPDPAAAGRLEQLAASLAHDCRGKALAAADLHLTLAFIGERPAGEAGSLAALLDGLPESLPGFALDTIGRFGPSLLWAGPSAQYDWLEALAHSVRERLDAGGVQFDRRALHPHVTLVRNAREREAVRAAAGPSQDTVIVEPWQLALGGTHEAPTAQRRYRWYRPVVINP
jgi:2'-5' RNA ligase